jgi:hypothetical protein
MAEHIGLRNAVKLLAAIEKKIADVGDDPNLATARREAQTMIEGAEALSPQQRTLLKEFISEYLASERFPFPPPPHTP